MRQRWNLKKTVTWFLMVASLGVFGLGMVGESDAWHRGYRGFRPKLSASLSGGLTLVDGTYSDEFGTFEATALSHAQAGVGIHYWVTPVLSLDLGLDSHFLTDYDTEESWGFLSLKPGVRLRFGTTYVRFAADLALGHNESEVMVGFLVGVGIRVPVSRRARFFGEANFQYLAGAGHMMPFHCKAGVEFFF